MDLKEILAFTPTPAPKRVSQPQSGPPESKKRRVAATEAVGSRLPQSLSSTDEPPLSEEEQLKLLDAIEETPEADELDESAIKKMIHAYDKRLLRNQELRVKFPDAPEKFMESELELHESIQELHALATTPDLYPLAVSMGLHKSLLSLLSHDNTDIAVGVIDLLQELTDVDTWEENEETSVTLIDALLDEDLIPLLVHCLERLDESNREEADGVHNALGIVENITEMGAEVSKQAGDPSLLSWLQKRLKARMAFDANKLYVSEMLSIFLQSEPAHRQLLGKQGIIDVLLQQLAVYKRHDPNTSEEAEFMENLFDCLCSCLQEEENKLRFLQGEGLQLMNLMLREKKTSRSGALKVIDHVLSGVGAESVSAQASHKFVDILGLRTLFPIFMKTPKKHQRKGMSAEEFEEHCIAVAASLLRLCTGSQRQRVLQKYLENDLEKVDRCIELHFKYWEKVEAVDAKIKADNGGQEDDEDEDENYMRRLDGGLFTLQRIDYMILDICDSGPEAVKQRVFHALSMRRASPKCIRDIMREYMSNLGGEENTKEKEQEELSDSAEFFVDGASRFDVQQGELGDCWLLAAVANLTMNPTVFRQVVPDDQSCSNDYAGIFHFRFWQYGKWVDVVVDDRLPTCNGKLVYMHSRDQNEFWSALLEKAYAKLYGSYEALKGGTTCEAMEDFTGGVAEMYELNSAPPNLFKVLLKAHERLSLMSCAIEPDPDVLEAETPLGLVKGHAYSVTSVKLMDIRTPRVTGQIPMIRIRNPWGNEAEWRGAWSDQSPEWQFIPDDDKEEVGLTFDKDGEFWMSFKDFLAHFSRLEIVNLSPDSLEEEQLAAQSKKCWESSVFEGAWVKGATAGGCRNHLETFHINPQYRITLEDPDDDDDDDKCTVIVGLMQKNRRSQRKHGLDCLTIGFTVYHLKSPESAPKPLDVKFFKYNASVARSPSFINLREVSCRFKLPPGVYCIVPSTFGPGEEGEFLLRIFSEKSNHMEENDEEVGVADADDEVWELASFKIMIIIMSYMS
nr:EOG090X03ST [Lepidurus arcticus]